MEIKTQTHIQQNRSDLIKNGTITNPDNIEKSFINTIKSQNKEQSYIQNVSNNNKSFSQNDIFILKNNISTMSGLEKNITVINEELIPLNNKITNLIETDPTNVNLSKFINEYSAKIESNNNGNKELLNGNYDIPTNNVIKSVRVVNMEEKISNETIIGVMNKENITKELRNEDIKQANTDLNYNNESVKTAGTLAQDIKLNWQTQNMNSKNINFSTLSKDNENIEVINNERIAIDEKGTAAVYTNAKSRQQTVFVNSNAQSMNELKNNFFEHRERMENVARNYRNNIDTTIRLNEDMFATKNLVANLNMDKLNESGFTLNSIYSNISPDTLNKLIKY